VHYRPLHQLSVWAETARRAAFPNADAYFLGCVSLPLFMDMSDHEQERVIQVVRETLLA
jgi:dTDP-4-amino-4,6-dideoxygalactose transaminase